MNKTLIVWDSELSTKLILIFRSSDAAPGLTLDALKTVILYKYSDFFSWKNNLKYEAH